MRRTDREITDAEKRVELLEVINEMAGELVDLENAEIASASATTARCISCR